MTRLLELKRPKERFSRSINVERDVEAAAIEGYLPVGRAIESLGRLAAALSNSKSEAALSITGPYGSGKSSLLVLVDALLGPVGSPSFEAAQTLLRASARATLDELLRAREVSGATEAGFVRAVVTAQREPVARTILRALLTGIERYVAATGSSQLHDARLNASALLRQAVGGNPPNSREIRRILKQITEVAPVLIAIDEFGKNLEAFSDSSSDGDLYLLQELAEWTRGTTSHRFALMTLQHMAFGDYAESVSSTQRREWVKIQGRFEDVPFVDTAEQTRALVAAAFNSPQARLQAPLRRWAEAQREELDAVGMLDLAADPQLLNDCWPLHPTALAVLPDLCQRYGQNERTMFSFLASTEPRGVVQFLATHELQRELPAVRLHHLYDFFLESAAGMVGVSADASRWIEIDSRIRESQGLSDAQLRVLKAIGVLNLVSAGGNLRASRAMLDYAVRDGLAGTKSSAEVGVRLDELMQSGLVTFRDFADEYRIWRGSDFDLQGALGGACWRRRDLPDHEVMQRVLPLRTVVAARHAHRTGTLRTFKRQWASQAGTVVSALSSDDYNDGLVVYVLGDGLPSNKVKATPRTKPTIYATTATHEELLTAAREQLAIEEVLATDETVTTDWVVRKELVERRLVAATDVKSAFERAYGVDEAKYHWARQEGSASTFRWRRVTRLPLSTVASEVADHYYCDAPPFHNELINRHELTSQAAKARRQLAEVMATNERAALLGLNGNGPDVTLYRSLFERFGLHRSKRGDFRFHEPSPSSAVRPVWRELGRVLKAAVDERANVRELYRELSLPPVGLREGVAPLLLLAYLLCHPGEFALYEHGTFRPKLVADVCERLLRNPQNFEVKCFAASSGPRLIFLEELTRRLAIPHPSGRKPSVVTVVSWFVAQLNALPAFAKKTKNIDPRARALREALQLATEPDVLLFEAVPVAVGGVPIQGLTSVDRELLEVLASRTAAAFHEIIEAFRRLTKVVKATIAENLLVSEEEMQESLARRSAELRDRVIDPRVRALVVALQAPMDIDDWVPYVAMQVAGPPMPSWSDEDLRRFQIAMHDLGSSFRRIEALHADVRAAGGGFEALRVSVNSTQGGDQVRLLTLEHGRRESVDSVLDEAIAHLSHEQGSKEQAAEWLLARLLERGLERDVHHLVGEGAYREAQVEEEETA